MLKIKSKSRLVPLFAFILLVTVIVLTVQPIQTGASGLQTPGADADFAVDWYSVDAGGSLAMQGGDYVLHGTAGQPDAGAMSSGSFAVQGGFWYQSLLHRLQELFLPLIQR